MAMLRAAFGLWAGHVHAHDMGLHAFDAVQVDRMREQLAAKDAAMLAAQPPLVRDLQVCLTSG